MHNMCWTLKNSSTTNVFTVILKARLNPKFQFVTKSLKQYQSSFRQVRSSPDQGANKENVTEQIKLNILNNSLNNNKNMFVISKSIDFSQFLNFLPMKETEIDSSLFHPTLHGQVHFGKEM